MKHKRFFLIFGLVCACAGLILWPFAKENYYARTIAIMSPAEIETQTRALNHLIIPPDGTPLRDVENVYGKLETAEIKTEEPSKGIPGFSSRELLPKSSKAEFRAILLGHVENGVTSQNGINHVCVSKGLKQVALGSGKSPQNIQELKDLQMGRERENRGVLLDLMLIRDKYGRALNVASWNDSK